MHHGYAIVSLLRGKNKSVIFKSVLFDMDGVIVDSLPTHALAAQNVLREYGYDLTSKDYMENFAGCTDLAGFTGFFRRYDKDIDVRPLVRQKADEYMSLCRGHLVAFPGVLEFIDELELQGIAMGLVTSALQGEADLTLDAFGIRNRFSAMVTAKDVNNSKPHPEPYLRGADKLGVSPKSCLVIEDATDGVEAALRAGMRCLAVTNTCSARDLSQATKVVDGLSARTVRELFPVMATV
jgi:HAD superfamily hydrolase (TIGR01509 family)